MADVRAAFRACPARRIAVVVEVQFHLRLGRMAHLRKPSTDVVVPLLDGVKKSVPRALATAIPKLVGKLAPFGFPVPHAVQRAGLIHPVKRLEMIADRDEDIALRGQRRAASQQPCINPAVEIF